MKIAAYVIHNKSEHRRLNVENLVQSLQKLGLEVGEVWWQPTDNFGRRRFAYLTGHFRTSLRYYKYRKNILKIKFNLIDLSFYILQTLRSASYLYFNQSALSHASTVSKVSSKHLLAWKIAINSDADFFIFFEDDAVVQGDIMTTLKKAFLNNSNAYIDLAGGFDEKIIAPNREISSIEDGNYVYNGLVTNTACAYAINRALLTDFLTLLDSGFSVFSEPIDFLLNTLGNCSSRSVVTIRPVVKPVIHGSMASEFVSWQTGSHKEI